MDADDRIIFNIPLETWLTHPPETLQTWVKNMEPVVLACMKKQELEHSTTIYAHTSSHRIYPYRKALQQKKKPSIMKTNYWHATRINITNKILATIQHHNSLPRFKQSRTITALTRKKKEFTYYNQAENCICRTGSKLLEEIQIGPPLSKSRIKTLVTIVIVIINIKI
jgi:hypothetical protein